MSSVMGRQNVAATTAYESRIRSNQTSQIRLLAILGAAFMAWMAYLFAAWIGSDQFRPVDPGPDALPALDAAMLLGVQVGGVLMTLWFLYAYVIRPKLATGRLSTDGLMVLGLGLLWWTDPTFNYIQNWLVYNGHLWNMGSWAGPVFPAWVAPNSQNFPEPIIVGLGQIFWLFTGALFGAACMRRARDRWNFGSLSVWAFGFVACFLFDLAAEVGSVFLGWYTMPGATRSLTLFAGTRYQVPMIEIFFGGWQTIGIASLCYVRDDKGHTWADRNADKLRVGESARTFIRFLAIVGALNLVSVAGYFIPIQLQGLHSGPWPAGLPSYFTMTCPSYKTSPESCGGPGLPIPRAH